YSFTANIAVVVATGSTHFIPPIPGIETLDAGTLLWNNRDAVSANTVPDHLVIMGSGAVGSEMATFYSAIGSKVTLISSGPEILPKFEPEAAAIVRKTLEAAGVVIKLSSHVIMIERRAANAVAVTLSDGEIIIGST
ncbi:hypothetical protein GP662_36385, partial [Escherichia coli]